MGHKRYGYLPKSKIWRNIVGEIGLFSESNNNTAKIAENTLKNVRKRFERFNEDPSVKASFEFLLKLAHAFQQDNPSAYLKAQNILESDDISLIRIGKAALNYKNELSESKEYQTIAKQSVVDAINKWYIKNKDSELSLFDNDIKPENVFKKIGDGKYFCEISRLYFSNFTERYLKYFLEREASAEIKNIELRNRFNKELDKHVDDLSKHAFESAKITQSFAAGWFNKNAKDEYPSEEKIKNFLNIAFGKMRSELLHEEMK